MTFMLQAHYAKWSEVLKLERPGPTDRANCPSGGYEFAQTVWRYVRLLAVAARTQGAKLSDDPVEFHKLDSYLDAYLQALQVHSTAMGILPPCDWVAPGQAWLPQRVPKLPGKADFVP